MENAAEALKMAGFTLLFVGALSIAMITIMQAKNTSEAIISYSDEKKYYSYVESDNKVTDESGNRIVTIYDIIPTLYRYSEEKYIVLFYDKDNSPLTIYDWDKGFYKKEQSKFKNKISYLNLELETKMYATWLGNESSVKKHVDDIVEYLLEKESTTTFIEKLGTTKNKYYNNTGEIVDETDEENEEQKEYKIITYIKK